MTTILNTTSNKIPKDLRKIYSLLAGEVFWLRAKWINYKYLFVNAPQSVNILGRCGQKLFFMVHQCFVDDFILTLCRLTDPAKDRQNNLNLSLEQLVIKLDDTQYPKLKKQLTLLLKRLRRKTSGVRNHRRKRVAHNDLNVSLKPNMLRSVARKNIDEALKDAEKFLDVFNFHFTNVRTQFDSLQIHDGADILIEKLSKAETYEKLEKDGVIENGAWRKTFVELLSAS